MRKLLGKTLVLAVMTAALLTAAAFAAESGTVNTDALRFRSEPSYRSHPRLSEHRRTGGNSGGLGRLVQGQP